MLWPCRPAGSIGPNFEIHRPLFLYFYYINCPTFPHRVKCPTFPHRDIYIYLSDPFKTKACSYSKNSC